MLAITIVIKNDKKVDYAKKKTLINITPVHNKDIHKALYFHRFKIFLILQHQTQILSLLLNFSLIFLPNKCCQKKYCLPAPNSHSSLYAPHVPLAFYLPLEVIYIKVLTPIMGKSSLRTGFIVLLIRLFL